MHHIAAARLLGRFRSDRDRQNHAAEDVVKGYAVLEDNPISSDSAKIAASGDDQGPVVGNALIGVAVAGPKTAPLESQLLQPARHPLQQRMGLRPFEQESEMGVLSPTATSPLAS